MTVDLKSVWEEWTALTRFVRSGKIAFEYEVRRWDAIVPSAATKVAVGYDEELSSYQVDLADHLGTLRDEHTLASLALLRSYALMEMHVRACLREVEAKGKATTLPRWSSGTFEDRCWELMKNGVESWAPQLLGVLSHDWSKVLGGLEGLIEISIVRNALAHGEPHVDASMVNRAKTSLPWAEGDRIKLDLVRLELYRRQLKAFMRSVEGGTVTLT